MNLVYLLFIGCSADDDGNQSCSDPREEEYFTACFEDSWCTAWNACGFEEDCQTTKPQMIHYENNDGTLDNDCTDAGTADSWSECMQRLEDASCEELKDAAQMGSENPLWIDVCITRSCV